jgi:hypothetical protein
MSVRLDHKAKASSGFVLGCIFDRTVLVFTTDKEGIMEARVASPSAERREPDTELACPMIHS